MATAYRFPGLVAVFVVIGACCLAGVARGARMAVPRVHLVRSPRQGRAPHPLAANHEVVADFADGTEDGVILVLGTAENGHDIEKLGCASRDPFDQLSRGGHGDSHGARCYRSDLGEHPAGAQLAMLVRADAEPGPSYISKASRVSGRGSGYALRHPALGRLEAARAKESMDKRLASDDAALESARLQRRNAVAEWRRRLVGAGGDGDALRAEMDARGESVMHVPPHVVGHARDPSPGMLVDAMGRAASAGTRLQLAHPVHVAAIEAAARKGYTRISAGVVRPGPPQARSGVERAAHDLATKDWSSRAGTISLADGADARPGASLRVLARPGDDVVFVSVGGVPYNNQSPMGAKQIAAAAAAAAAPATDEKPGGVDRERERAQVMSLRGSHRSGSRVARDDTLQDDDQDHDDGGSATVSESGTSRALVPQDNVDGDEWPVYRPASDPDREMHAAMDLLRRVAPQGTHVVPARKWVRSSMSQPVGLQRWIHAPVPTDPDVEDMLERIDRDRLASNIRSATARGEKRASDAVDGDDDDERWDAGRHLVRHVSRAWRALGLEVRSVASRCGPSVYTVINNGHAGPGSPMVDDADHVGAVIVGAHYDRTRPHGGDESPREVGANDGASGAASLIELAHVLVDENGSGSGTGSGNGQSGEANRIPVSFPATRAPVILAAYCGAGAGDAGARAVVRDLIERGPRVTTAITGDLLAYRDPAEPVQIAFPSLRRNPTVTEVASRAVRAYLPSAAVCNRRLHLGDHDVFLEHGIPATSITSRCGAVADPAYTVAMRVPPGASSGPSDGSAVADVVDREGFDIERQLAASVRALAASAIILAGGIGDPTPLTSASKTNPTSTSTSTTSQSITKNPALPYDGHDESEGSVDDFATDGARLPPLGPMLSAQQ